MTGGIEALDPTRYNSRTVDENGQTPIPETMLCGRCGCPYDLEDNFCRQCGLPLHDANLPSVPEESQVPAVWRPPVPAVVVKGAAFIAAGTVAEMLMKRLVRGAFGRGSGDEKAPARREQGEVVRQPEPPDGDAQMVSETFLMRRIRFRR